MNTASISYIVQVTDNYGFFRDVKDYPSYENAKEALPLFLNDFKATVRRGRVVKEIREVVEGSEMFNEYGRGFDVR